jgi:hypothetical protein
MSILLRNPIVDTGFCVREVRGNEVLGDTATGMRHVRARVRVGDGGVAPRTSLVTYVLFCARSRGTRGRLSGECKRAK